MKKAFVLAFAIVATGFGLICRGEGGEIKSIPVPGFRPVQPGEHPRLLFRKSDLPELRRRANTPEGKRIVAQLKKALGGGEAMPTEFNPLKVPYVSSISLPMGAYSISHAAGFGMLYQLTGEQKYADLGRKCLELGLEGQRDRDPEARYSMRYAGEELRLGPSLAWTALGYDLLYDGLDPEFRQKIAKFIQDYEEEAPDNRYRKTFEKTGKWPRLDIKTQAMNPRYHPGSNHYANITGGNGMALLGILGDPGTDVGKVTTYLERLEQNAVYALGGFGSRGFFHEGQGPSHTATYPVFLAWWKSVRNVLGKDYITPNEKLHWLTLRWVGEVTQDTDGSPIYPARIELFGPGYGSANIPANGSINDGRFAQGFGVLPDKYKPYALWAYNNYFKDAAGEKFAYDTSYYPHHAIQALVNWPFDTKPVNPTGHLPTAYQDSQGHIVIRNGWHEDTSKDIVVSFLDGSVGGNSKRTWSSLPMKVIAMGTLRDIPIGWPVKGVDIKSLTQEGEVTTLQTSDGWFVLDFSGRGGSPLVAISNQRFDTGYSVQHLSQSAGGLNVLTLSSGEDHPQLVESDNGSLTLAGLQLTPSKTGVALSAAGTASTAMINAYEAKGMDPTLDRVNADTIKDPGPPVSLLTFNREDAMQRGEALYFRDAISGKWIGRTINVRPEHLLPDGVHGEAFVMRGGAVPSVLSATDSEAESKEVTIPKAGFKGILTSVILPAGGDWQIGSGSYTVSMWMRLPFESGNTTGVFLSPYQLSYHFCNDKGPTLGVRGNAGGIETKFPSATQSWVHVTYVGDAERKIVTAYADGEFIARGAWKRTWEEHQPTFFGGWRRGGGISLPMNGMPAMDADNLAIWHRALTAGEVHALYLKEKNGQAPDGTIADTHRPPNAYIDVDEPVGAAPLAVTFSAARSIDPQSPDEPQLQYTWDFGDGATGSGVTAEHSYQQDGEYQATLTVTDRAGLTAQSFYTIKVFNRAPSAVISEGDGILSAAESVDPDGQPLTMVWDTPSGQKTGETVPVETVKPGSHLYTLTVTDSMGASSKVFYTVSVPDSQGYRLPDTPSDVVHGMHVRFFKAFPRAEDALSGLPNFYGPGVRSKFVVEHETVARQWDITTVANGQREFAATYGGYIAVPEDGDYQILAEGVHHYAFQIIGLPVIRIESGRGGDTRPSGGKTIPLSEAPRYKLRAGLHRFNLHWMTIKLSNSAQYHPTWFKLTLVKDDGTSLVIGADDVYRSLLPGEAVALGKPAERGPDLASLGPDLSPAVVPIPGNRPPEVKLVAEPVAPACLGSQAYRLSVEVSDPDGDAVSWQWAGGSGLTHDNEPSIVDIFTSGDYQISVRAEDANGAATTAVTTLRVPPVTGYSNGINFAWNRHDREVQGTHRAWPGETLGAVPMASWNSFQPAREKEVAKGDAPIRSEPGRALPDTDWYVTFDALGNVVPLTFTGTKMPFTPVAFSDVPQRLPDHRLMYLGFEFEKDEVMKMQNIPFKTYDLVLYLSGDVAKPAPADAVWGQWAEEESEDEDNNKRKRGRPNKTPLSVIINGSPIELPAAAVGPIQTHRWAGYHRLLTEQQPDGNVLIIRNLSGPELSIDVRGSILCGGQILAKP